MVLANLKNDGDFRTLIPEVGIPHWVVLTGMSQQWDSWNEDSSLNWVRINNPYNNRSEYYPWKDFKVSLSIETGYGFVELWQQ